MAFSPQNLTILIADDSMAIRVLVRETLRAFGVQRTIECSNGSEAFRTVCDRLVDLVIIDWQMEPMDGIEATRRIRWEAPSPNCGVPILMMTGHAERSRVEAARDAGVTEFLAKPISAGALHQRLETIFERPRPFVRSPTYIGPDRRRRKTPLPGAPKRRLADQPGGKLPDDTTPNDGGPNDIVFDIEITDD